MLERDIISSVENRTEFEITGLYRMYMDRDDIPDNMLRKWKSPVRGALEVSVQIVKKVEELYAKVISQDDEGVQLNVQAALKSPEYQAYLMAIAELEKINLNDMSQLEKVAFFLNIYQCMYVHYFIKMTNEGRGVDNNNQQASYL